MSDRWCFKRDDDGHDYLIPLDMVEEFDKLLYETDDHYESFINKFDEMRIGYPSGYSFTDPRIG